MFDDYYESLPCSFLELSELERVFEKNAEEGLMIHKLSIAGTQGRYRKSAPGKGHIAIGAYDKMLSEAVQNSPEFERFVRGFVGHGWQQLCCFLNLAVFYSEEEERPPVPSAARAFYEKGVYRLTARKERIWLLMRMLGVLFSALIFAGGFGISWSIIESSYRQRGYAAPMTVFLLLLFLAFLSGTLSLSFRHIRACRYLRRGERVPEFEAFWNSEAIMLLCGVLLAVSCIVFGMMEYNPKALMYGGMGAALSGAAFIWNYSNYKRGKREEFARRFSLVIACFITFLMMCVSYPLPGEYRFQSSSGRQGDWREAKTRRILETGMDPAQMGWYGSTDSFYEENRNLLCHEELVIYFVDDRDWMRRSGNGYDKYRYVGTMRAELREEPYLERYLRGKGLSLDGAEKLSAGERLSYYLTESGKEIIGTSGTEVVIYFLSTYDERSFQPEDEKLLEAIARLE